MLNRVLTAFRRRFTAAPKWRPELAPDPMVPPRALVLGGQLVEVLISRAALVEILPAIWRIEHGLRSKAADSVIVDEMVKVVVAATGRPAAEVELWRISAEEMVSLTALIETATRVAVDAAGGRPPHKVRSKHAA